MSGYIGTQPVPQATQTRDAFTATNNQTSFPTSGYTPEFLDVFLNGVKLAASDYTATNGSDVVLAAGATTGDILEVVSYGTFEVLNPTFDGNVTFTGNASFGDNDKAIFGDGSDLQIYHDGSNSYIKDTGAGDLLIEGSDNIWLMQSGGAKVFLNTIDSNAINLYFNNSKKLETTNTGIYVTGTVAATAYTGDGSALTGTGSPSIDDNGNATAITIDSSENVLYGTTDTTLYNNTTGTGTKIGGDGRLDVARQADTVATFNRTGSSDGEVIRVVSSGTTVGSTGVVGGNDLYIAGGATGIRFDSDVAKIYPTNGTGAVSNGAVDIGEANFRFKDAYLSGGVYLGGTAAANKLDDYEQGTFNLTLRSDGNEPSTKVTVPCNYILVGNVVNFWGTQASINNTAYNGGMRFEGLPFAAPSPYSIGNIAIDNMGNYSGSYGPYTMISGTIVYAVRHMSNATSWNFVQHNSTTTGGVYLSGAYLVS